MCPTTGALTTVLCACKCIPTTMVPFARRRLAAEGECPPGTAEMARPDTLEEFASMPTKDQPKKPRARVQRLGELCGRSQDVLELADVGDRDQRYPAWQLR